MRDLSFFDRLTMFAGLFFASAAGVVDAGAGAPEIPDGGGDAGNSTGIGDNGDSDVASDIADSSDADASLAADTEGAEEGTEQFRDGRSVPNHVKQALAKLRDVDPKAADIARRAWYEAGDYKQVYPSVQEARDSRDLIESLGGQDGISGMQQEIRDYAAELTAFAHGDPSAVESLARDYPDALPKHVSNGLAKLQQINPEAYERTAGGVVANVLKDRGVASSVHRLMELISDGKQQAAHELAGKLAEWIRGVDEFSKSKPQQAEESPEARRIREREAALDTREKRDFHGRVGSQVIGLLNDSINKALMPLMKGKTLTKEQREGVINEARAVLTKGFEGNKGYQARMKGLLEQGDINAIARYIRGQLDPKNVATAVRSAWSTRGFATAARTATTASATTPQIGSKPDPTKVDWSKDRTRSRYMGDGVTGEYTERGTGKVLKFKW